MGETIPPLSYTLAWCAQAQLYFYYSILIPLKFIFSTPDVRHMPHVACWSHATTRKKTQHL